MGLYEKLSAIQNELKVPKGQRNDFGKYNYRSAEDILEKVKPLCREHSTTLLLTDTIKMIGDRIYVEARAELHDWGSDEVIVTTASARESLTKKGMDDSQVTGTASSYARKYALNGMFDIDDTKDADTNEYRRTIDKAEEEGKKAKKKAESQTGQEIDKVKKEYQLRCKKGNVGAQDILEKAGWNAKEGRATLEHFAKANMILDEMGVPA